MARPKTPKTRRRYSIGEWYGTGLEKLSTRQWLEYAKREIEVDSVTGTPCPFQTANAICNKKGGVCSLRLYEQTGDGPVAGTGPIITTCPQRFSEGDEIYRWIGDTILQTSEPIVLGEIGFLDRLRPESEPPDEDTRDFIGRIDNVLVHPTQIPIDWCGVELQAVYFSGKAMKKEFSLLAEREHAVLPFPAAYRRPDWRSSGPKRLLPQLQTKIPTIRTWGKKMAVVIDESFFASLIGLERERHLSNSEIAWFVVGYDSTPKGWKLVRREVAFTKLDASVKALTGGVPLSRERFEAELRLKLGTFHPEHPVALRVSKTC